MGALKGLARGTAKGAKKGGHVGAVLGGVKGAFSGGGTRGIAVLLVVVLLISAAPGLFLIVVMGALMSSVSASSQLAEGSVQVAGEDGVENAQTTLDAAHAYDVPWELISAVRRVQSGESELRPPGDHDPELDPDEFEPDDETWVVPLPEGSYRVGSGFGQPGRLWSLGYHMGQDFVAARGTPILAAHQGLVITAGQGPDSGWAGLYVEIDHGNGLTGVYAHASHIADGLVPGVVVQSGDQIAAVGSTGNTTGPHLHFELRLRGTPVDPLRYLRGIPAASGGDDLEGGVVRGAGHFWGPYRIDADALDELGVEYERAENLTWSSGQIGHWLAAGWSEHARPRASRTLSAGVALTSGEGASLDNKSAEAVATRDAYVAAIAELPVRGAGRDFAERVYDTAMAWHLGESSGETSPDGPDDGVVCYVGDGETVTGTTTRGEKVVIGEGQLAHAAVVVQTALGMDELGAAGEHAMVTAVMTGLQESSLRNLANLKVPESLEHPHDGLGRDYDSVNVFQQRAYANNSAWGSVDQLMIPAHAAAAFFGRAEGARAPGLLDVPGWEKTRPGALAQKVQVSAHPDAYDKWEPVAAKVVGVALGIECDTGDPPSDGDDREVLVAAAMDQLGVPYVWGGGDENGPTDGGFDCSGLTVYAYAQIGQRLPRTSAEQWERVRSSADGHVGTAAELTRGDLVFFDTGRTVGVDHVGIYLGEGEMVHAPRPGKEVEVVDIMSGYYAERFVGGGVP
ncbi:peptidoglycan DD-metalloendopeptidase family protein [Phytoactinopolyspora mesophila]|uniref:peptidoglycan DD-metalloendopeptidase family protein n=1 Tax=Phytoactinopolyspora mesophila TaxID=2650750 RepID=UPI001391AC83